MRVRLESGDEPGYEPRLLMSSHLRGQGSRGGRVRQGNRYCGRHPDQHIQPVFHHSFGAHLAPAWACRWLLTLYVVAVVP